jgi:hypothetical protein
MSASSPDETPTPDYKASIDFLQRWCKGGPWVLVAIDPNKKGLEAGTFSGNDIKGLEAWLEEWGTRKKYNVYFTVNPCVRALKTKPSREHIASLSWLHVDLDPRAGEDLDEERKRIVALLSDPTSKGLPKPTALVFSGGGYQAFWRLKEPHLLDGTAETYEDAKRWNKQLELLLDGDNCHNVDRIMRLPGTINRPDPKKRKKGRVEVRAELIEFNSTQHDLKLFTKAPIVVSSAPGFSGGTVTVSGNIARLSSVDELPEGVSDQAKVCIVQGFDPDNPGKFGSSRSEWLFFVCCELVRAGCDDDTIYSVITDPDFGISVSVRDKGSNVESYAIRQIERAREEAEDPMLREFNDKHALIGSIGSKGLCRILGEERDKKGRPVIVYQTQTDFMLRYKKRSVDWVTADGKPASKPAALWWLEHVRGRYFEGVTFAPGKPPVVDGKYNRWRGFACDASPDGSCDLYLAHIKEVICGRNDDHYEYLLNYLAHIVQNPDLPAEVAIVLRGGQGTGKGVFVWWFGKLFGRHFITVTSSELLAGKFSGHLAEGIVLFADEQIASDDKRVAARLKTIITEVEIMSESKGVDAEMADNHLHVFMASNERWVVPVDGDDRRYVVLDVSTERKQQGPYFAAIEAEMLSGGLEKLLHTLLTRDLGEWHPRQNRPVTTAHADQKRASLKGLEAVWHDVLWSGELPEFCQRLKDDSVFLPTRRFAEYVSTREKWRSPTGCSDHALGDMLGKDGMGFEKDEDPSPGSRAKGYVIPPLPKARAAWDRAKWIEPTWEAADEWVIRDFDPPAHETFRPVGPG